MVYAAPTWNLANIITEVRGITGRPDASMMTDAYIQDKINYYYQYVLPKELKIFWGYSYYQFYTQANVDQYPAPVLTFQTLNPQVYANGFPIEWYLSPDNFYSDYPQQENTTVVATGTGSLNSFTFQIPAFPIIVGSLYVTDGTQIAQDNGSGGFINPSTGNSLAGSISYSTGAVSGLAFPSAPAANTNISQSSQTYMANRPQAILYFPSAPLTTATQAAITATNFFVLRPVPDQVYLIKMQGIQIPAPFINTTDVPFRPDLGPLIALGASIHIFKLFNQMDQIDQYMPEFMRFKDVCMQDTYEEYLYQRSVPAF